MYAGWASSAWSAPSFRWTASAASAAAAAADDEVAETRQRWKLFCFLLPPAERQAASKTVKASVRAPYVSKNKREASRKSTDWVGEAQAEPSAALTQSLHHLHMPNVSCGSGKIRRHDGTPTAGLGLSTPPPASTPRHKKRAQVSSGGHQCKHMGTNNPSQQQNKTKQKAPTA